MLQTDTCIFSQKATKVNVINYSNYKGPIVLEMLRNSHSVYAFVLRCLFNCLCYNQNQISRTLEKNIFKCLFSHITSCLLSKSILS